MRDLVTEEYDDSALGVAQPAGAAHLSVVTGSTSGHVHDVAARGLTLGRVGGGAECTFEDRRMSRLHARVVADGHAWGLVDLGSRNGGFVDGQPFGAGARVPLDDGSVVRLGDTLLVFRRGLADRGVDAEREVFPGGSTVAAEVRRRVTILAAGRGHVLILGETGTGKERVARRIGRTVPPRPFVPQNCAEMSRELARSELFGHVRGAFSGATTAKEGLIASARDGALFLDELGELSLDVQGELLRFLEDGSYRPIGSTELQHSACRVIAATNVDLDAAVRAGSFRRDLLARLRADNTPLQLPPLRDRREDILGWARLFIDEASPHELPSELWTAGAAECLVLYPWPENLRELRGVMRGLVEREIPWPLESHLLPDTIQGHRRLLRGPEPAVEANESHGEGGDRTDPTRDEIERALVETEGRVRAASALLGVERRKLYRLCERLDINIDSYRNGG